MCLGIIQPIEKSAVNSLHYSFCPQAILFWTKMLGCFYFDNLISVSRIMCLMAHQHKTLCRSHACLIFINWSVSKSFGYSIVNAYFWDILSPAKCEKGNGKKEYTRTKRHSILTMHMEAGWLGETNLQAEKHFYHHMFKYVLNIYTGM